MDTVPKRILKIRVTIRPGFRGHVLFFGLCPSVRVGFRKSAVCPGFWPNPQVHLNVANCKGVRWHETKKESSLVFNTRCQYKMSVASQNAILVQASCTVYRTSLALSSVHSVSIQKHVSLFV